MDDDNNPVVFGEIQPARDLWPGIESRLARRRPRMGYAAGIAASLVIAWVVALQIGSNAPVSDLQMRATTMQVSHEAVVEQLAVHPVPAEFAPALSTLVSAEAEIHGAIDGGAPNPALLRMLANVHQQRMDLLMKTVTTRSVI